MSSKSKDPNATAATNFDLQTKDGACDCYATYPSREGSYPAILFLMDAYGPREYLYEMADHLASYGYYVLLPNLFYRQRRAPVVDVHFPVTKETSAEARKQIMALFPSYDPEAALRDVGAFFDFLSKEKRVRGKKFGLTGYCMGGGVALRAAEEFPDQVAAAASFHAGRLASDAPKSVHRFVDKIKAPVYIAHADNDESMPADQIERLAKALEEAQVRYEAETYKGAAHGFTMMDLPAYDPQALERHWEKLIALMESELKK